MKRINKYQFGIRQVDVLIVESTYGVQVHEPRAERERRFTTNIHDIVRRGGRCLIPVFALGRAQELLLILDEYWSAHPELHSIPIYYASSLAKKCMTVYQTYINMMNDRIRSQFDLSNPFKFKHISNLKSMEHFDDIGPCVVMASPGMLQSGLSRELFEKWCSDKRNGVVLPGYCVEGTLAKHIMSEPAEITSASGVSLPLNMSVSYVSVPSTSLSYLVLFNNSNISNLNISQLILILNFILVLFYYLFI
jgi:cleavage and polyadenylation specificity factor subunit 3